MFLTGELGSVDVSAKLKPGMCNEDPHPQSYLVSALRFYITGRSLFHNRAAIYQSINSSGIPPSLALLIPHEPTKFSEGNTLFIVGPDALKIGDPR